MLATLFMADLWRELTWVLFGVFGRKAHCCRVPERQMWAPRFIPIRVLRIRLVFSTRNELLWPCRPCRPSSLPGCFSAGVPARKTVLKFMGWYFQSLCGRQFGLPHRLLWLIGFLWESYCNIISYCNNITFCSN